MHSTTAAPSVGFIAGQIVGWALLAYLIGFVAHLLWVPFRDSRPWGRSWWSHGWRTAGLVAGCLLMLPFLVDFVFLRGQGTLAILTALFNGWNN